jgi:predicted transcriptional regulator
MGDRGTVLTQEYGNPLTTTRGSNSVFPGDYACCRFRSMIEDISESPSMTDSQPTAARSVKNGIPALLLGHREREVLAILHELQCATVQQVAERLNCELAYTTVMTTLDRLFRKGLVERKKKSRAFLYAATLSIRDLEEQRATHLVRRFFSESDARPEMLVSCLVDAVHDYDTELLDQLESGIRMARAQSAEADASREEPRHAEDEQ